VAVSLACSEKARHFESAARAAVELLSRLLSHPLPADTILNVNVPDLPWEQIVGWRVCRLGNRHRAEPCIREVDPRGRPIYWIGPAGPAQDAGPGTDFHAIGEKYIALTPIHVDLTRYQALEEVGQWAVGLSAAKASA
jgi:5'-nucleotidase